jgi:hypothetical protein
MNRQNKRFVIQRHTKGPDTHWDLMLEEDDTLQTWRLDAPPNELKQNSANAINICDHDPKFLTYQGTVNKGKAKVQIADAGTYNIIQQHPEKTELNLNGKILKGVFTLARIENNNWQFTPN